MAWPAVAAQPDMGGRSRRHGRRWFGRLEQEDQRLKKHYGRWMDIVRSVELESCILTKLRKPFVPVNLVGPLYWVPSSRGSIHFFVRNKEALPCMQRYGWWVRPVNGGNIFFHEIQRPFRLVPDVRWRNHYFARNKEAFPCVRPWTQLSASPRTVHVRWKSFLDHVDHATQRVPRRWTTARPRKGTTWSWGRRDSGCPRGEEYEGSLVRLRCHRRRITGGVGEWSGGMAWPAVGVVWGW